VSDDMGRRHFIQFRTIKICLNDLPAIAVAGLSARMVVTPRREEGSCLMTWDAATSSRCSAARRRCGRSRNASTRRHPVEWARR
jgi:hypothetical protein